MSDVLPSSEAAHQLRALIEQLLAHPEETVEVGREQEREAVLVAASRYDEMVEREQAVRDLAWALFAEDRTENPVGEPVSWEEAQSRRRSRT